MMQINQSRYPSNGWILPVNKWGFWSIFKQMGSYEPVNDNKECE